MTFGATGIGDLSNNKYAAIMREVAEGLSGWAGLLLLPFLIYRIVANDDASLISLKALLVVVCSDVIAKKLANLLLASILAILITPLVMIEKIQMAQNVQNTILAIFGLSLCVAIWFYAGIAINYAYS